MIPRKRRTAAKLFAAQRDRRKLFARIQQKRGAVYRWILGPKPWSKPKR